MISLGTSTLRGASGGGAAPSLSVVRALYESELPLDASLDWTFLPPVTGTATAFVSGGGIVCTIAAGVEAREHAGATLGDAFPQASSWAIAMRLQQVEAVNSGWQRILLRVGEAPDDCVAAILTGAGSLDLGLFDGGTWGGLAGRGATAAARDAHQAGELVVVVRRTPVAVASELRVGASIEAAMAAQPLWVLTSSDPTALSRSLGRLVRVELETIGPVAASEERILEARAIVGGRL